MSRRLTTEEFIEKAIRIHGDKYDYSLVEYENSSKRVRIKCNTCGNAFDQVPATHLSGHGCPVCAQATVVHKLREKSGMTTDKYIARAREVHGDKYDYSKVNYVNANTKVEIVCPVHGSFFQVPFSHLRGTGCAECSKLMTDVFVGRLRERYGDRFDYTDTVYVDLRTPVTLKCNTCGSIITRNYVQ